MTAAMTSNSLQALVDSGSTSQSSSPTSPSAQSRPSANVNGVGSSAGLSSTSSGATLDPPPGMSYTDFLRTWSDAHVGRWLSDIKCGHHASTFKAHDIRGDVLLELDQITLKEMAIVSVGDRLRIVNGVKSLRLKCSSGGTAFASIMNRPRVHDYGRNQSVNGESGSHHVRSGSRRLDSSRPAPLHLSPSASPDLPRLVRDGQDSARSYSSNIRPLPQPSSSSSSSHSTPTTSHSSRSNLPPLPPPPRGQPPLPPTAPARTPRTLLPPANTIAGRRTPTQPQPELSPFPTQSGMHGSNLLTPSTQAQGRSGVSPPLGQRTPIRSQSPSTLAVSPANHALSRSPPDNVAHSRNGSLPSSAPIKVSTRPTGNTPHPYSSGPQHLSPIAESFSSRSATSTPPPPLRSNTLPLRPTTPLYTNNPSLDDLRRRLVKFMLPDEGKSTTINTADCSGGADVLIKALKKFGKLAGRGDSDGADATTANGGLSVEGWGAYLDWGQMDAVGAPLTEAQLLSICNAPPDDPAREHGLTLRLISRVKHSVGSSPTSMVFSHPDADVDADLLLSEPLTAATPSTNAMKRASSVSILSGLGVPIPEKALNTSEASSPSQSPTKSPTSRRAPSKMRNFLRPPSELITTHLAEYFPFTEKKVLERTRRQSMLRGGAVPDKRASIISWNPPPPSRFSVSTLGSQPQGSPRVSVSSDPERPPTPSANANVSRLIPPRVSVIIADEDVQAPGPDATQASKRQSNPHFLPPVAFPSESLAESLNLDPGQMGAGRRMSTSSRRLSYITELRSKRDVSDTLSLMTVDEITAEVESRRKSADVRKDLQESGDEWTEVNVGDDDEKHSIKVEEEEEEYESESEDSETEEEALDDATVAEDDEEETGKAITSRGKERTIKWIKGALIGAGSFGKVYLGMDAATGLLMAVKQVELPTGSAPNEERKKSMLSALEHEIELLKDFHHENIVQYHSSCIDDDHLNIFLEYVPGGSVTTLLRSYGAFAEPLVRNWVRQILLGLNYLHERDIIHRDIKGANMLVDNKGGIKISDFGISKKVEDNLLPGHRAHRPSLQGSVFWMAPEVVKQTAYTRKADIWSIGCLVVEMLTGEHPWAQLTQMQAIFKIGSSAKPTIPADISPEADNFLQLTFELDHNARPSAAELLRHPWIANQPMPFAP
ncbi:Pkinase-domain-containing protein [Amylocystis lapponica]|nr:Pkinase-domain-containing protein [Amylocystis lapponica]